MPTEEELLKMARDMPENERKRAESWEKFLSTLIELEEAQIALQLTMVRFACNEEKAKEIIKGMNINMPAIEMVHAPTFKKQ